MNGPGRYLESEKILDTLADLDQSGHMSPAELIAAAIVANTNATLALAASNAEARALHWDEVLT